MNEHTIEQLIENLWEIIDEAKAVPLTADKCIIDRDKALAKSALLSSDVAAAFDPNHPNVAEANNTSYLGKGVTLIKYTGRGGKSGSNDANAEFIGRLRKIMDDNNVNWQTAELGKVDVGGGGTVAAYMANRNIVTVDAGVPVLSMHAPMEIVSKLDCYMTMLACKAIYLA